MNMGMVNRIFNLFNKSNQNLTMLTDGVTDEKEKPVTKQEEQYHPLNVYSSDKHELVYKADPIVATAVDLKAELLVKKGGEIVVLNSEGVEDKKGEDIREKVLEPIFAKCNFWSELLPSLQRNREVFGKAGLLYIFGKSGGKIINLRLVPRMLFFDYEREGNQTIKKSGNTPSGYVWRPDGIKVKHLTHGEAHMFVSNPFGGWEPLSSLDSLYKPVTWKRNMEQGYSNSVWRKGNPLFVAEWDKSKAIQPYVTKEDMTAMNKAMINLNSSKHNAVMPPGWNLRILEPSDITRLQDATKVFILQIASRLRVPLPFLIGTGESSNRASQESHMEYMIDTIIALQNYWKTQVEDYILKPIMDNYGITSHVATIEFGEVEEEDLNAIAERLNHVQFLNLFTKEEMREMMGYQPEMPDSKYEEEEVSPPSDDVKDDDKEKKEE